MTAVDRPRAPGSFAAAVNWMGGLTLLLFWLPVVGPLIAGVVGGIKAGTVGRAVAAVFVPAIPHGRARRGRRHLPRRLVSLGAAGRPGRGRDCLLNVVPLLAGAWRALCLLPCFTGHRRKPVRVQGRRATYPLPRPDT